MTEIAQLAASALLPFSDSKTLDTISSTDDQIDNVKSDNEQPEWGDDLTSENDSDEDMADSNFSASHFSGTAVEDAD